jgi:hypothetical protein
MEAQAAADARRAASGKGKGSSMRWTGGATPQRKASSSRKLSGSDAPAGLAGSGGAAIELSSITMSDASGGGGGSPSSSSAWFSSPSGRGSARSADAQEARIGKTENVMNPLFLLNGGGSAASAIGGGPGMASRAHEAIMSCAEPPPMELWSLFQQSYGAMYDQSQAMSDQLSKSKHAAARVAELAAAFGIPEDSVNAFLAGEAGMPVGVPGAAAGAAGGVAGSRRGFVRQRSEFQPSMVSGGSSSTPAAAAAAADSAGGDGGSPVSPRARVGSTGPSFTAQRVLARGDSVRTASPPGPPLPPGGRSLVLARMASSRRGARLNSQASDTDGSIAGAGDASPTPPSGGFGGQPLRGADE